MPGLDHYCATCRYALVREVDKQHEGYRFIHGYAVASRIEAHEPVAVPLTEFTAVNMLCDFCSANAPALAYTFVAVTVVSTGADGQSVHERMGTDWAVCTGCARQIEARNVNGLIARVVRRWPGSEAHVQAHVRDVYVALLSHPFEHRAMPLATSVPGPA